MNDRYIARARVKWHEKPDGPTLPEIPVQYLRPVQPDRVGQDVVFLQGDNRGYEATIKEISGASAVVQVTGTRLILDAKLKQLCLRAPGDYSW